MSLQSSITGLKVACFVTIGFGVLMSFSLFTPAMAITEYLFDFVFFPIDGIQSVSTDAGRLLLAISGGIMAGWGVMIFLLATKFYPTNPMVGRAVILPGILVWFLADSLGSIVVGAWVNAILNTGLLALFIIPVLSYSLQGKPQPE